MSTERRERLQALAHSEPKALAARYAQLPKMAPAASDLRSPEIGLVMLRGRTGGGGAPFNLGEATVTRASVGLPDGEVGHAMILGRNLEKARMVAHLDALAQHPDWAAHIEEHFVQPAAADREAARARLAEETEATRVDFFTMVRGED